MKTQKRSLNIVVVGACPLPCSRGTPVRILRSAEGLADLGHNVHVVTYHFGEPDQAIKHDRLTLHRIPRVPFYQKLQPGPSLAKLLILDPLLVMKLNSVLKNHEIDLIYAHHYEALMAALMVRTLKRRPVFYDAHTMLETELPAYGNVLVAPILKATGRWIDRRVPRVADHIIAVSEEIAGRLSDHIRNSSQVTVIGNALEVGHFMRCNWFPTARKDQKKILVFTGNLAAYQGIDLMLEAFARLRGRRGDVLLRIITKDDFSTYVPLANRLGIENDIEIVQSDFDALPFEIARASIALNPRLSMEGIPQKLLNYMAVGVPIVSFAGSARNLTNGKNGLVIPDGDTELFASALARLLDDQETAHKLGVAARNDAREVGSWLEMARKLEGVFSNLTAGASPISAIGKRG